MSLSKPLSTAVVLLAIAFWGGPGYSQSPARSVEALPLVLHPHGFEPREVTLPAGPTLFQVYNRVGLRDLDLRLDREVKVEGRPGPPDRLTVRAERVNRKKRKWHELRDLEAGTYILSVEGRPKWTCTITVTATK